MATTPNFTATPVAAVGQLSAANANRDGTGTIVNIYTAPASGARIDEIIIQATGTNTTGMIRFFLHDGTNTRLWFEQAITSAITPNATTPALRAAVRNDTRTDLPLLLLPSGWSLRASTEKSETFNVIALGGSF